MSELRTEFERSDLCKTMVGTGTDANWNLKRHPDDAAQYAGEYLWSRLEAAWQGFQSGHAAGLEQQAKRIAELEARLEITGQYDGIAARDETIRLLEAENERAFQMLSAYGVPKERAKTVANGIDVLMMRMEKAGHSANTVGGPTPGAAPACER